MKSLVLSNDSLWIELDSIIRRYDLVFIVSDEYSLKIARSLFESKMLDETQKKVAFLSVYSLNYKLNRHIVINVSPLQMARISDIYHTYEASDRLISLSRSDSYGGLWNYVNSGILSYDEMIRAFLM